MKKRTLLFGAGEGSKQFRINEAESREFLAYIDNDEKRHNTKFEELIIISPLNIGNYDYDEIVITTQWANEVKEQLIKKLQIDDSKIIIPPKSTLKKPQPFKDEKTRNLARKIIKTLSTSAITDNLPLCVDFGTLLGIVRDDDVILWDDDVDFALDINLNQNLDKWIIENMYKVSDAIKWSLSKQLDKNNRVISYQIEFIDNDFNSFITSITSRENNGEFSMHLASLGQWYAPSKHFDKLEKIIFQDTIIQVPSDTEKYLTFVYGNWKKPNKNMTMGDYNHIGNISYQDFNNAGLKANKYD